MFDILYMCTYLLYIVELFLAETSLIGNVGKSFKLGLKLSSGCPGSTELKQLHTYVVYNVSFLIVWFSFTYMYMYVYVYVCACTLYTVYPIIISPVL